MLAAALELARSMILGAAAEEYGVLCGSLVSASEIKMCSGISGTEKAAETLGRAIDALVSGCDMLENALNETPEKILFALAELRRTVDKLEYLVSERRWPLPKYREMLLIC